MDRLFRQNNKIQLFLAGVVIFIIYYVVVNTTAYPYDSAQYWNEASKFGLDQFTLRNYDIPLRGYLTSLFYYLPQKLAYITGGSAHLFFWVISSILYSYTFLIVLPDLFEQFFGIEITKWIRYIGYFFTDIFGVDFFSFD